MKTIHKYWKISELVENIGKIEFPEFQREPTVWKLVKKQSLIDSILRGFDISSIYFHRKESGGYDCIDGRQRLNAILSFLGINGSDEDHNGFNLKIENEIYNDEGLFNDIDSHRYERIKDTPWGQQIRDYKLNIVEISEVDNDEELNLLFLRLQIAAVLNAGEKLHAMTGDMRDAIFYDIKEHTFFDKINIPPRRYAKEQVAAQIVLNEFSRRDNGTFHRSRYIDLQEFFKAHGKFTPKDKRTILKIKSNLDKTVECFQQRLKHLNNRAISVSVYLFVSQLIEEGKQDEIDQFVDFLEMFLRTLKWQLPQGVRMNPAYYDLVRFQTNITQAAGERSAIERRRDFLGSYFYHYKGNNAIKGDEEYRKNTGIDPEMQRRQVRL
jgi:hypothetical protein